MSEPVGDELVSDGTVERLSIEAEEPPVKRILDVICHNDLARSMGLDREEMWRVKWYQRWVAQFVLSRTRPM